MMRAVSIVAVLTRIFKFVSIVLTMVKVLGATAVSSRVHLIVSVDLSVRTLVAPVALLVRAVFHFAHWWAVSVTASLPVLIGLVIHAILIKFVCLLLHGGRIPAAHLGILRVLKFVAEITAQSVFCLAPTSAPLVVEVALSTCGAGVRPSVVAWCLT